MAGGDGQEVPGCAPDCGADRAEITLVLPDDTRAVRAALMRVSSRLAEMRAPADLVARAELALAEVLNNVVEHALPGAAEARIELWVTPEDGALLCEVRDHGLPMPGGRLPAGLEPAHTQEIAGLPEGGFGWYMIHTLVSDLTYRREEDANVLSFRVTEAAGAQA